MKLSRPVALGILALIAILLLWLMLNQSDGGGSTESPTSPTVTQEGPSQPTIDPTEDFQTFDPDAPEDPQDDEATEEDATGAGSGAAGTGQDQAGSADGPVGIDTRDWDDIDACRDGDLPGELDEVTDDVEAGGPFDYPYKDGSTFQNREALLPDEERGYYREYTVETPGSSDRGARRIVTGGGETDPEVWYYTDDHYRSFCEFAP